MKHCTSCGQPLTVEDIFCGTCGARNTAPPPVDTHYPAQSKPPGTKKAGGIIACILALLVIGGAAFWFFGLGDSGGTGGTGADGGGSLVGRWEYRGQYRGEDAIVIYIFNADGTGEMGSILSPGTGLEFEDISDTTWSIDTPGIVTITATGGTPKEWNYSISGRTLTLTSVMMGDRLGFVLTRAS